MLDGMMAEAPFEVLFMILCLLSGIPLALGALPPPNSLTATLPPLLIRLWGLTLAIGGGITLTGLIMAHLYRQRRFVEGLIIEGGGLVALGSAVFVFALAIIVVNGTAAVFGISVYFMLTASCFARWRTTRRAVKKMKTALDLERKLQSGE